jgi:glycosyltransferase involved in cell wall biosynthesis|tara:strand:+ start:1097 stop:2263 length:1167 start_codon:yes stop_codon:yes gene_type:complete
MIKIFIRKINSVFYYFQRDMTLLLKIVIKKINFFKLLVKRKLIYNKLKVGIGTIFYIQGGVANHILSLNKYLKTTNTTIPNLALGHIIDPKTFCDWHDDNSLIDNKILHSHADTWFINYCHKKQKNSNTKWLHTYHLPYFEDCHGPFDNWKIEMNNALFNVAKYADVKISVGKWLKEYLFNEYSIESIYIPNGVDVKKCNKAKSERFITKYNIKDFILFTSKIDYVKNPIEFVQLAELLPNEKFVMIGPGITINVLENQLQNSLPSNLTVIGEYLKHETILDAIAACKVFVMTSRIEGLPTALMEAMALAKPVVASKVHGCEELIEDGKFGYLYTLGNINDLMEKTKSALNDNKIGDKAKENIVKNYDWKIVAPQIDDLYKRLLNEKT